MVPTNSTSADTPKMTCISIWSRQVFSVAGIVRYRLIVQRRWVGEGTSFRADRRLEVQEKLRNCNDVFQIERPTQHHLDGQRHHEQQQVSHHHVPDKTHPLVKAAEEPDRHYRR